MNVRMRTCPRCRHSYPDTIKHDCQAEPEQFNPEIFPGVFVSPNPYHEEKEQFNEYWVVERNLETIWTPEHWPYESMEHAVNIAINLASLSAVGSLAAVRIVHYTGTGAEVVALWDEDGRRVR